MSTRFSVSMVSKRAAITRFSWSALSQAMMNQVQTEIAASCGTAFLSQSDVNLSPRDRALLRQTIFIEKKLLDFPINQNIDLGDFEAALARNGHRLTGLEVDFL